MPQNLEVSEDKIRLSNSMPEKHNHLSNRRKRNPRGRTRRESQRNQQMAMVTKVKEGEFQKVETSQCFSTWKPQGDQAPEEDRHWRVLLFCPVLAVEKGKSLRLSIVHFK